MNTAICSVFTTRQSSLGGFGRSKEHTVTTAIGTKEPDSAPKFLPRERPVVGAVVEGYRDFFPGVDSYPSNHRN